MLKKEYFLVAQEQKVGARGHQALLEHSLDIWSTNIYIIIISYAKSVISIAVPHRQNYNCKLHLWNSAKILDQG